MTSTSLPKKPGLLGHESSSSESLSAPRASALSNKLANVLSASYADLDIRDALETLDKRGVENTPETRRQLRLDVQREVIECNGEIIREFGLVAEQLKRIGTAVASLNRSCDDMRRHVSAAREQTAPVLTEASTLMVQRRQVEVKQQILDAFNAHFTLSEDELRTLTSIAEPVDDHFFNVLAKVKRIHDDCQVLLGTEDQTLGLEIMDQSSRTLNGAFQKLYQWIQREFKTLNLENPQISSSIRRALRVLAERPTLFQGCMDFFAAAREHILSDSFQTALTGASADGDGPQDTKPIELFAHDPLRYVGDMLAWVHSASVSEREALEVLFISEGDEIAKGIQAGLDQEPWSRAVDGEEQSDVFDGEKALGDLVNRDLEGVSRKLRQRVDQVIQGHEEPTLAYRIANLVNFYRVTFAKLLNDDSGLLQTFAALEASAMRQFRVTIGDAMAAVRADLPPPPADLGAPQILTSALKQLTVLMTSYDTSLLQAATQGSGFQPILAEALDPYLEVCKQLSQSLTEPARGIFVLNCLLSAKKCLTKYPAFTSERLSAIQETIDEHMDQLVEAQHSFLLHTSGLHPLIVALAHLSSSAEDLRSIPTLPPFRRTALTETSQTLDDFLPSALMDATERLKRLQDKGLAHDVTEEATARFCEDFEFLEGKVEAADALRDGEQGDGEGEEDEGPRLREMFPRTSGEIRVLLS
ncbi:MAG: Golgi transport complex subunit 6 [Thelocarpon impressellum]|nr:MAG: Golgi transport complex subunit 6 [Thelocarpon impressellum]